MEELKNKDLKTQNNKFDSQSIGLLAKLLFIRAIEECSQEQNYNQILDDCSKRNYSFNDSSFPPNYNSLVRGLNIDDSKDSFLYTYWNKIAWVRICELIGEKALIFPKSDKQLFFLNEIKQGINKNTNLITAICALGEKSSRLINLFVSKKYSTFGCLAVKLCVEGCWKEIVLDDYLPCDIKNGTLCFAQHSKDKNIYIWLSVLEKAFAKIKGSYYLASKMSIQEILRTLTGAPVLIHDNNKKELWNEILIGFKKGYILLASVGDTISSEELLQDINLLSASYTILEAHEVELENGSEFLLKIKNNFGVSDWCGDWSMFSGMWSDDLKTMLNINFDRDKQNNIFWMSFKDYLHYFSKLIICKIKDDYYYTSCNINMLNQNFSLINLSISKQIDNLFNEDLNANSQVKQYKSILTVNMKQNKTCRVILSKLDEINSVVYIDGFMGNTSELFKKYFLSPGEYLIYLEIEDFKKANLSVYSEKKTSLKLLNNNDFPHILNVIYSSAGRNSDKKIYFNEEEAPLCYKVSKHCNSGYYYTYYCNQEEDIVLKEETKYTKFKDLILLPPFTGTSYNIEVGPGKEELVIIKTLGSFQEVAFSLSVNSFLVFGRAKLLEFTKNKGKKSKRKFLKMNIVKILFRK